METRRNIVYGFIILILAFVFIACDNGTKNNDLPGTITISPSSNAFTGMQLTANYSGSETVNYQWKKGTDNVGTNSNEYTPFEVGSYTVTVSAKGYNSITSASVLVSVLSILSGSITISPSSNAFTGTKLTAFYSGNELVNYQWKKDTDNVGTNSSEYTPIEAGNYTVTVSAEGYNGITSLPVFISAIRTFGGSITISPSSNAIIGTKLTASYNGGEFIFTNVNYQWKKDTDDVGTNSREYTPTEAGSYTVTISAEGYNSKTSAPITVNLPTLQGNITISPSGSVFINTKLTASFSGIEMVSYQWKKNTDNGLVDVGTNNSEYTPTETGYYVVIVSAEGYNSKTSAPVNVSLPNLSGNITISPNGMVSPGRQLIASYSGSETVSYQWEKDGAIVGTNSNEFYASMVGNYTVTVTADGYNSKTSSVVTITNFVPGTYYNGTGVLADRIVFNNNRSYTASAVNASGQLVTVSSGSYSISGDIIGIGGGVTFTIINSSTIRENSTWNTTWTRR